MTTRRRRAVAPRRLGRAVGRPGRLRGGRAWTALRTLGDDDLAGDRISGYLALIEGDATRIQHAYVRSLPDDDRDRYLDAIGQASGEAQEELDTVPGVLVAMEGAPYALGPSLVELIAADGGNDAVDEAFDDPPATAEHMVDPRSYFAGDSAHEVTAPVVPTGGEQIGEHDRLGALPLFLLLSERVRALPFHQLVQANESAEPPAGDRDRDRTGGFRLPRGLSHTSRWVRKNASVRSQASSAAA